MDYLSKPTPVNSIKPKQPTRSTMPNMTSVTRPITHTGKSPPASQPTTVQPKPKPISMGKPTPINAKPVPKTLQQRAEAEIKQTEMKRKAELQAQVSSLSEFAELPVTPQRSTVQFMRPNPGIRPVDGSSDVGMLSNATMARQLEQWADEQPQHSSDIAQREARYDANYHTHSIINNKDSVGMCARCGLTGFDLQQFTCNQIKAAPPKMVAPNTKTAVPVPVQTKPRNLSSSQMFGRKPQGLATSKFVDETHLNKPNIGNERINPESPITWNDLFHGKPTTDPQPRVLITAPVLEKHPGTNFVKKNQPQMMRPVKSSSNSSVPGCNIIVVAGAGTGKSTTIQNGVDAIFDSMHVEFKPSDEQVAIWDAMRSGEKPRSVMVCAFNKSIANKMNDEMVKRPELRCNTIHSFGNQMIRRAGLGGKGKPTKRKNSYVMQDVMPATLLELYPLMCWTMDRVVSLVKNQLIDWRFETESPESVYNRLAERYDIPQDDDWDEHIINWLPTVMQAHYDKTHIMDFDDMVWWPNVRDDVRVDRQDLVIVDEAQDMNPSQQGVIFKTGRRIIPVGDRNQAIYGFTGADVKAIDTFSDQLKATPIGCVELPLSISRRCPVKGVELANRVVPTLRAAPGAIEGEIFQRREEQGLDFAGPKDLVICRTNAPVVSHCLRMLRNNKKARIQGQDIGDRLVQFIKNFHATDVADLCNKVQEHTEKEMEKLSKRKFAESKMSLLTDTSDCVIAFTSGMNSVEAVTKRIESLFADSNTEGTLFSSIHRAKGLEAHNVVFLQNDKCPSPMAKQQWQLEQEWNLWYVAVTRFQKQLYMVRSAQKQVSIDEDL